MIRENFKTCVSYVRIDFKSTPKSHFTETGAAFAAPVSLKFTRKKFTLIHKGL